MANQAEAERSRRARIILAEAEEQAAAKLLEAGLQIDKSPSAIKLRLYQTLSNIAAEKNSTILFPFPEEVLPRNAKEWNFERLVFRFWGNPIVGQKEVPNYLFSTNGLCDTIAFKH